MAYPHRSGEPCPECEDGEKKVLHNPVAREANKVVCTECDWEAENMATG